MALTPASIRLDLKCGKGSISEGEKCSKGTATKRAPRAGATEKFLKNAGSIGFVGGLGYTAVALAKGNVSHTVGGLSAAMASTSAFNAGEAMMYERKGQKAKAKMARLQAGIGAGYALAGIGALGYEARATRNYTKNVANGTYTRETARKTQAAGESYRNTYQGRYGGASGAGYRGARPPRRGYQGNPFQELGVSTSASTAELKKAWKAKMMQHHPDRGGDPEVAKKINEAYQAILRSKGIKDSVYADGFDIDWDALAL
jgi:hypothetical protein